MEIGDPIREFIAEPAEDPFKREQPQPRRETLPEPTRLPEPATTPVQVPA